MIVTIGRMTEEPYAEIIRCIRTPDSVNIDLVSVIDGTAELPDGVPPEVYITEDDFKGHPAAIRRWLQPRCPRIHTVIMVGQDLEETNRNDLIGRRFR